jgi:predicted enzyme related to lactoylglutathione lyase
MTFSRRRFLQTGGFIAAGLSIGPAIMHAMKQQAANLADELKIVPSPTSSENDFDFLVGTWKILNRKLKTRLSNSNEWLEFAATLEMRKILNGLGNFESFKATLEGKPFEGMALRLFDPKSRLWSIYWADSNAGVLDRNPVVGSFEGTLGKFYARDVFNGKEITVLYQWDKKDPQQPRWSQAFSVDNGKTWEWNWHMTASSQAGMFEHAKFTELPVTNQDRAIKFFTEKVGLLVDRDAPYQTGWRWVELAIPGAETKILFSQRPDENPRENPSLVLVTGDVRKSHETLKAKGVNFTQEPQEAPWSPGQLYALFRDSENNTILIAERGA